MFRLIDKLRLKIMEFRLDRGKTATKFEIYLHRKLIAYYLFRELPYPSRYYKDPIKKDYALKRLGAGHEGILRPAVYRMRSGERYVPNIAKKSITPQRVTLQGIFRPSPSRSGGLAEELFL